MARRNRALAEEVATRLRQGADVVHDARRIHVDTLVHEPLRNRHMVELAGIGQIMRAIGRTGLRQRVEHVA